ncbi:MAG: 1,4-alpha-glucan branching protein GlgB [Bacteroidota bacterium]
MNENVKSYSLFSDMDIHLFKEGRHYRLFEKLGSRSIELNGEKGTYFAVWAPNAEAVSVIGNFNYWQRNDHPLYPKWDESGIWEGFVPGIGDNDLYKYAIKTKSGEILEKSDLYSFSWETPPKTATRVHGLDYTWKDEKWMSERKQKNSLDAPISVYEVHLGSWKRKGDYGQDFLSYQDLVKELVPYVKEMEYTHVQFLPIMEHPFYGSWGYQCLGYFAPTSRYGSPQDFMALIDALHQADIGVFLDWVPSHFPEDKHGIRNYDGTALYEHEDPRRGYHPDWTSFIFNYGRKEVRCFLISSAIYWLEKYHIDGLRVDAVASMLYLDYSRKEGEWLPNEDGGRENYEAIGFLKELNEEVYRSFPDVQTIAEESTSFPMVSRPTFSGGLGFGLKWMMGWMNDTLVYFRRDSIHKKFHHFEISFSLSYAFSENFMLPLSHDEVVHGKGSILERMPGDIWQKFANARLLYGYMYTHPGAKLNFMGNEIGQWQEWQSNQSLDWHLTNEPFHKGLKNLIHELNKIYRKERPLYELSYSGEGFEWIDFNDHQNSVLAYIRKDKKGNALVVVANFTPTKHDYYKIGVPFQTKCREILSTDSEEFGGSGVLNRNIVIENQQSHGRSSNITISLPPLGISLIKGV